MKKETLCQGPLSIQIRHECFDSAGMLSLTQSDFAFSIEEKARIQWLSECGVYFVQKSHCIRDTVERQSSCLVINIHSYSRGGGGLMRE